MSAIQTFRKRPLTVETMLWDGTPERAQQIKTWVGLALSNEPGFLDVHELAGVNHNARLWNSQERCWLPVPVGHRVVKGALGEFHPIGPAAVAETYELIEP